ncbi:MAG: hypothetical protein UZ09_BCD002002247 [Bacteroidetes bacterium OLB9]|nr:MAG: hypothetical protein UZ09_BCD002002247 [Bacteroidetes bacterium OLB9]
MAPQIHCKQLGRQEGKNLIDYSSQRAS